MSRENVEIMRRLYEAWHEGGLDAVIPYFDPEIVWEDLDVLPGAATYRGHDELREGFAKFYDAWGDMTFTAEEMIDAGDAVVVAHRWQGSGRSSGTPIDTFTWNVFRLRDGLVVHRRAYQSREQALADAELDE